MRKLRKLIRDFTFPLRCLFIAKVTPRELLKLFFQLSDLGKIFETPTEVIEGYAVMARDCHVMIFTEERKLAFNFTEGRGLALQVQDEGKEWEEVYRELSRQVQPGEWVQIILKLPKIIQACHSYSPVCKEATEAYLSYQRGLTLHES